MKQRKGKTMAVILALVMCFTLLPVQALAAEGSVYMRAGMPDLEVNSTVIGFAGQEWWVIGYNGSGVYSDLNDGTATLLMKGDYGTSAFRTGGLTANPGWKKYSDTLWYEGDWDQPNNYAGSTLQLKEIASGFPGKEEALIIARTLESDYDDISGPTVNEKLWPLSLDEYKKIKEDKSNSNYYKVLGSDLFWKRSPVNEVRLVINEGTVYNAFATTLKVRPAFNINLSSVLFTSAATGGKADAGLGDGLQSAQEPTGTLKFTVKAESQTLDVAATEAQAAQTGSTLTFGYKNATTGTNQFVSCVLLSSGGEVAYYGKLADSSSNASGSLNIPLSGVDNGTYTLQIFSEEANGDNYTDFCSEPVTMTLEVIDGTGTVSGFAGTIDATAPVLSAGSAVRTASATAEVSFTSSEEGTYYWQIDGTAPTDADELVNSGASSGTMVSGLNTIELTGLMAGEHTIYIAAKDVVGNVGNMLTISIPAPEIHAVTFNTDGGSSVDAQEVEHGSTAARPEDPTKEGYTFAGWYTGTDFATEYSFSTPVAADINLYAKWNIIKYTVSFNTDGGSSIAAQEVEYGSAATRPAEDPAKEGYTFAGWYTGTDFATEYNFSTPVAADITVFAKWEIATKNVTFNTNGGSAVATQTVDYGATATRPADPTRTGYTFVNWYSDPSLETLYDFSAPVTADITVYAKWTQNSGGGSAGSGSDTDSNNSNNNAGAVNVKITTTSGNTANINDVKVTTKDNTTSVALSENIMGNFVKNAIEEGRQENKASVTVTVSAPDQSKTVTVGIPVPSIEELARSSENATMTVATPVGSVTLDMDALDTTAANATGDTVVIGITNVEKSSLPAEQQKLVGDRPVVDLSITSDGKQISQLNGTATVSIPYTPAENEDISDIVVWYLADSGDLVPIACEYKDGMVTFKTTHFSRYAVANFPFKDVSADNWFYSSMAKMRSLGIMNGTSDTAFSPEESATRAMVVTMLYRLAYKPEISLTDVFSDVQSGAYYEKAVIWASRNGFVKGVGEGKYEPYAFITREQLVTILYRYAGSPVITMEDVLSNYSDSDKIDDYAKMAFAWAVKVGVIQGNADNTLNPDGKATRAEIATMFTNYVENVK